MKYGVIIFIVTSFLIANTYTDGKYVQILKSWKKYYQMAGIAFVGISAYAYIKKFPDKSQGFIHSANGIIKQLPIDKDTGDLLTPVLNFTSQSFSPQQQYNQNLDYRNTYQSMPPQQKRMLASGKNNTKRSVSETKKKYVASIQDWKCGKCKKKLPAWFEVDHKVRLDMGGSNHIDNLVALCRDCHGEKTAYENF